MSEEETRLTQAGLAVLEAIEKHGLNYREALSVAEMVRIALERSLMAQAQVEMKLLFGPGWLSKGAR